MTEIDLEALEGAYRKRTPSSQAAFAATRQLVPSGSPSGLGFRSPYPIYVERAEGCYLWDVDGNRYLDLMSGDWLLPMGHGHPQIVAAIQDQLTRGTTFAMPEATLSYAYPRLLQERMPSIERIRFTTSGTEATMNTLRLARAFTGRGKIAKIRGGYHGTHDASLIANGRHPDPDQISPGLIPGTAENVVLLPFNDVAGTTTVLERDGDDIAGVIVEPVLGGTGFIPATKEYLAALRRLTTDHGIVLVFDEVVTFQLGTGGAQGHYGVRPDLTALGKTIGGGLPMGAFGGRADIMDIVDPAINAMSSLRHATTGGGMPICLAAGYAQVRCLTPEIHAHLTALGDQLRSGINELGRAKSLPLQATGIAHFFGVHWTPTPVVDFESALTSDGRIVGALITALFNEGYMIFGNGAGVLSAPMTNVHVEELIAAIDRSVTALNLK